ncbi:MAG: hypothetical protein ACTSVV_06600 [Promethearchaeota archaeon]
MISSKIFWICPKNSCNHKKIEIKYSYDGSINTSTFKEIILHFLTHLKKNNFFFGAVDIQKIFLDNSPENILTDSDKRKYGDSGSIIWKNRIRTALSILRSKGYIETWNKEDVPPFFNRDINNRRDYRVRRRTQKFFTNFSIYDDWELYNLNEISTTKKDNNIILNHNNKKELIKKEVSITPNKYEMEKVYWICPKISCKNERIEIVRNKEGTIKTTTYQEIIIHFLKHLKKTNPFFGVIDIQKIFLDNAPENVLNEKDKNMHYGSDPIWKNRIRSALNILKRKGYIETYQKSEVPLNIKPNISDNRIYRTRKRTTKFFQIFSTYNDWELYEVNDFSEEFYELKTKKTTQISELESLTEENFILEHFPIHNKVNLIIKFQNKLYGIFNEEISFFVPEITKFLKTLDVDKKAEFFQTVGFLWRKKLQILNLDQENKKESFIESLLLQLNINESNIIKINEVHFLLDLDKNLIVLNKQNSLINSILNIQYDNFRLIILNEIDFTNQVIELVKNPNIKKKFQIQEDNFSKINIKKKYEKVEMKNNKINQDSSEIFTLIRELKKLLDEGIIEEEEFKIKKKDLLNRI